MDAKVERESSVKRLYSEVLEDGRTVIYFEKNGKVTLPPLPGKTPEERTAWEQRVTRDISKISYGIRARRLAEEGKA